MWGTLIAGSIFFLIAIGTTSGIQHLDIMDESALLNAEIQTNVEKLPVTIIEAGSSGEKNSVVVVKTHDGKRAECRNVNVYWKIFDKIGETTEVFILDKDSPYLDKIEKIKKIRGKAFSESLFCLYSIDKMNETAF